MAMSSVASPPLLVEPAADALVTLVPVLVALRVAVAAVQEDRVGRRERQLAEELVAVALEVGHRAVDVGAVVARRASARSRRRRRRGWSRTIGPPTLAINQSLSSSNVERRIVSRSAVRLSGWIW